MGNQYFYKYQKFDQYSERVFLHKKLWVSSPLDFDDPYDCRIDFSFDATIEDITEFYRRELELSPELYSSNEEKAQKLQELLEVHLTRSANEIQKLRDQFDLQRLKQIGVICLTLKKNNKDMWVSYSEDHTGYCIEFNKTPLARLKPKEVIYDDNPPVLDFYKSTREEKAEIQFYYKREKMSFEHEYRILLQHGHHEYDFGENYINAVYLGYSMSSEHEEKIKKWLKTWRKKVNIYRAKSENGDFEIVPF